MKLWESSVVVLEYDENNRILLQTWKSFATSEKFREAVEKTVEFFKLKKASTLLVDAVNSGIVKKEDAEYAAQLIKGLVKHNFKAQAFVMPTNAFVQMSVKNYDTSTSDVSKIQYFDNVDKAKDWLRKQ